MEPQITRNTQIDTGKGGVNLQFRRIIGRPLTVLHAPGSGLVHDCARLGFPSHNGLQWALRYDEVVVGEYTIDHFAYCSLWPLPF
jgi:hypothetical protein